MNLVVFISGRGSNLEALLKDQSGYQITHVIGNKKNIKGFEIAKQYAVAHSFINWSDKTQAETIANEILSEEQPDLIVLAGFMKILSNDFVNQFKNKIINIHPSLLPAYPGLNTHQRVLDDKQTEHGASVHFVDGLLDHGKVVSQTVINVEKNDTADSLADRLIQKEHKLLIKTVGLIANKQIYWDKNQLLFNNNSLKKPIIIK